MSVLLIFHSCILVSLRLAPPHPIPLQGNLRQAINQRQLIDNTRRRAVIAMRICPLEFLSCDVLSFATVADPASVEAAFAVEIEWLEELQTCETKPSLKLKPTT